MSLNRAFIRAYERQPARQSPAAAIEPARAREAAVSLEARHPPRQDWPAINSVSLPASEAFFSAYAASAPAYRQEAPIPPSYAASADAPVRDCDAHDWPAQTAAPWTTGRVDPPHRAAAGDHQPAYVPPWRAVPEQRDSFAAAPAALLPNVADQPMLSGNTPPRALGEPALQVERFAWPSVCLTLLERAERSFHTLAEQVFLGAADGRKLLVISGYHRGEGRTTFALTLARAMAGRGARVVLVDADFEHPGLADQLGVSPEVGWQDVLTGQLPLEEALIESLSDGVTLLPIIAQYDWTPSIEPANIHRDLELLRSSYDFVFVDSGLWGDNGANGTSIPLWEAMSPDGAIMVHDASTSSLVNPAITERRLAQRRIPWWGIVENFAQSRK